MTLVRHRLAPKYFKQWNESFIPKNSRVMAREPFQDHALEWHVSWAWVSWWRMCQWGPVFVCLGVGRKGGQSLVGMCSKNVCPSRKGRKKAFQRFRWNKAHEQVRLNQKNLPASHWSQVRPTVRCLQVHSPDVLLHIRSRLPSGSHSQGVQPSTVKS